MRVIAGKLGGRHFEAPAGHRTHPMSEKARGALFNVLGDVGGLTVLDAFCGSGALSLEAVSRGASSAVAVDVDQSAAETAKTNAQVLELKQITVIRANMASWAKYNAQARFDLIFCDPPYDKPQDATIIRVASLLAKGGTLVVSQPSNVPNLDLPGLKVVKTKTLGDAQLLFYQ